MDERTVVLKTLDISSFFTEYGREIIGVLIAVIVMRLIRMLIRRRNQRKAFLKEQEQANQLLRNEALNNEILNPARRPGDVTEQKHAYKVEFSEKSQGGKAGSAKGLFAGGGRSGHGKKPGNSAAGALLKINEYSSLSKRSYMFKDNETVRVGNQYGNTAILAGNPDDSVLYFEITPYKNQFYIRSACAEKVVISRSGSQRVLGEKNLVLCDGDRVSVGGKVYEISFFRQ